MLVCRSTHGAFLVQCCSDGGTCARAGTPHASKQPSNACVREAVKEVSTPVYMPSRLAFLC